MDAVSEQPTRLRRGLLIVLSSPVRRRQIDDRPHASGGRLRSADVGVGNHPAHAPGESDDVDYHFVDDAEFERMIAASEFVEWAQVFGSRYGTPKAPVKQALKDGRDILFDIDWQGARQLGTRLRGASRDDLPVATVDG
jgi:guanylate kinase